tara:strand:+ start:135 stop:3542 length:3408 start_codon:yes stop_codon:yes gene_type:complete
MPLTGVRACLGAFVSARLQIQRLQFFAEMTMTRVTTITGLLLGLLLGSSAHAQPSALQHSLQVTLDPIANSIAVTDSLRLPAAKGKPGEYQFRLNQTLSLDSLQGSNFSIEALPNTQTGAAADAGREIAPSTAYRLVVTDDSGKITLSYSGTINSDAKQLSAEYAQSFSSTTGIISEQGVYLDHSSVWLPNFDSGLMSFEMEVQFAPSAQGWTAVSQGDELGVNAWRSEQAMEEVYLVAANFTTYRSESTGVSLLAYLREPDSNLATRYLDATERYLALYEPLLGGYPFSKFALVENFWETGYGMPSFTLLGEQIIRFPFILESSYPHEILHNWWGNSVYPDYETGNWSEGLTAYLADHLFQEMNAAGPDYRKDMLGRYRSAVSESADFPLRNFTSRNSAASQAVGYGKTLMLWHMLRIELGDELFLDTLRKLYSQRQFTRTSYADIEAIFSRASGKDLRAFFAQWVERVGAPELAVQVSSLDSGRAQVQLRQTQMADPYVLKVPIALYYEGEEEAQIIKIDMSAREANLTIENYGALQGVVVDPYFDVFRRLDVAEMPPTIRQMFGAERIQFVVPIDHRELWIEMAQFFSADSGVNADIVMAEDFRLLPTDQSVWVLGRNNPAMSIVEDAVAHYGVGFSEAGLSMLGSELPFSNRSTVLTASHPENPELTIGWIHADSAQAMPGLMEKLPHYGKYSYLSFVGSEPTNDVKGQWESPDSPLLWYKPGLALERKLALLPEVAPLAVLPPKYLPSALSSHVETLVAPNMEGRGIGSQGIERAAQYIEEQFAAIGLEALQGQYRDTWDQSLENGQQITVSNIIGLLPGSDERFSEAPIILGAHYDHLGVQSDAGSAATLYPGADDNASGVAILLEVAKRLHNSFTGLRPILFVAFTGEESGLLGSRHFVATPPAPFETEDLFAMVNLDSVGRLEGRSLEVFGSGSAYEWPFMAQGIGFTIGVPSQFPAQDIAGSDHVSFLEAGIPAIHLFSGLHGNYHRSSDTLDKLDLNGMSDIALWVEEAIVYLAGRDQPLRVTLENAPLREQAASSEARSASLGSVPEFDYAGEGVQISGVTPGGAAELAGLQAGDVLLEFDGVRITSLQEYSNFIRESAPGDRVLLQIRRGEQQIEIEVELQAR